MADPGVGFAQQLKRAFSLYRIYGLEHDMGRSAERAAFDALQAGLQASALEFVFEARGLRCGDDLVLEDEGDDSLTRTVFSEGVEGLTFHPGLRPDELTTLLHCWYRGLTGGIEAEHSFATQVWEEEFDHIEARFRPALADDGVTDAPSRTVRQARDVLSALIDPTASSRPHRVDAGALAVIQEIPALQGLTAAHLEAADASTGHPVPRLTEAERAELHRGARLVGRGAGQRVLLFLWKCHAEAPSNLQQAMYAFVERIVGTLVSGHRLGELRSALNRIVAEPGASEVLLTHVFTDDAVQALVERLEGEAADDALALLRMVPSGRLPRLLEALPRAQGRVRGRLESVVRDRAPGPERMADWVLDAETETVRHVLQIAESLSSEHRDQVLRAGLLHGSSEIRIRSVEAIRASELERYRSLVASNLARADMPEWQAIVRLLVRAKDPLAAELLAVRLLESEHHLDLRLEWLRSLASVQGPRALQVLSRVLRDARSRELRKAAALALSHFDEPEAVATLREAGKPLFSDPAVRQACRTALRRIRDRLDGTEPR